MIERDFVPQYIDLADSAIEEARLLSQTIQDPLCAWQVYLAHLGLMGFNAWVESHLEDAGLALRYDRSQARLLPSTVPDRPSVVTQLRLGEFRLCLLAVTESDEGLEIPAVAIEHPEQAGHFYGVVAVNAEAQAVRFQGFLRHDQVTGEARDGVYEVAIEQLESMGDRLFFLAMGLDAGAIVLPQGMRRMEPIRQMMVRPIMNVTAWTKRQFERLSESVEDLTVSTNLQVAHGFRSMASSGSLMSKTDLVQEIRSELLSQGYSIPLDVQARYQNLPFSGQTVQIALAVWEIPENPSEWSLFVIARPMEALSKEIQLHIHHGEEEICTIMLDEHGVYKFMQAIGSLDEQFILSISDSENSLILPM